MQRCKKPAKLEMPASGALLENAFTSLSKNSAARKLPPRSSTGFRGAAFPNSSSARSPRHGVAGEREGSRDGIRIAAPIERTCIEKCGPDHQRRQQSGAWAEFVGALTQFAAPDGEAVETWRCAVTRQNTKAGRPQGRARDQASAGVVLRLLLDLAVVASARNSSVMAASALVIARS